MGGGTNHVVKRIISITNQPFHFINQLRLKVISESVATLSQEIILIRNTCRYTQDLTLKLKFRGMNETKTTIQVNTITK